MLRRGQAGNQMLIFVFLLLLIIIGGGIAGGIIAFFGSGYDFRQAESAVLNYEIEDCILNSGINFESDDFYEVCRLNKDVIEKNENFIKIEIAGEEVFNNKIGTDEGTCGLAISGRINTLKCTINEFILDGDNYKIVTSSEQVRERKSVQ